MIITIILMISNLPFLKVLQTAGVTWPQFLSLPFEKQQTYYCARIRRSLNRLVKYEDPKLKVLYDKFKEGAKYRASNLIILPHMVDHNVFIYNGQKYTKLKINSSMVGKYIGCYRLTRKKPTHTKVSKKKAPTGKKG